MIYIFRINLIRSNYVYVSFLLFSSICPRLSGVVRIFPECLIMDLNIHNNKISRQRNFSAPFMMTSGLSKSMKSRIVLMLKQE